MFNENDESSCIVMFFVIISQSACVCVCVGESILITYFIYKPFVLSIYKNKSLAYFIKEIHILTAFLSYPVNFISAICLKML